LFHTLLSFFINLYTSYQYILAINFYRLRFFFFGYFPFFFVAVQKEKSNKEIQHLTKIIYSSTSK